MKRIVCLTVAVLGSALLLHAEDAAKSKDTTDRASAGTENSAAYDQNRTTGTDAASAGNQGTAQKTSGDNMEGTHMGTNMGSTGEQKKKTTWSYFNYEYE